MPCASTFPDFPRLETKRLVLRRIVPADAGDLYRIFADEETMRYWSCRPFTSLGQAEALIKAMAQSWLGGTGIHWAIALRGEERLIGKCGFNEWRKAHRRGDISYLIDREHWGKGFKLSNWVQCYDWTSGDGYNNFATWLENAK